MTVKPNIKIAEWKNHLGQIPDLEIHSRVKLITNLGDEIWVVLILVTGKDSWFPALLPDGKEANFTNRNNIFYIGMVDTTPDGYHFDRGDFVLFDSNNVHEVYVRN